MITATDPGKHVLFASLKGQRKGLSFNWDHCLSKHWNKKQQTRKSAAKRYGLSVKLIVQWKWRLHGTMVSMLASCVDDTASEVLHQSTSWRVYQWTVLCRVTVYKYIVLVNQWNIVLKYGYCGQNGSKTIIVTKDISNTGLLPPSENNNDNVLFWALSATLN